MLVKKKEREPGEGKREHLEFKLEKSDFDGERHYQLSRCMLLCFQKVIYSPDDTLIHNLVLRLRWDLARHIGTKILERTNQFFLNKVLSTPSATLFERGVSEVLGFTYGHDEQQDLTGTKLLAVIAVASFFDRIHQLYRGADGGGKATGSETTNVFLENLVYLAQNHGTGHDGFPLIPALLDIAGRCGKLICVDRASTKEKTVEQRQSLEYWRHHQKVFR